MKRYSLDVIIPIYKSSSNFELLKAIYSVSKFQSYLPDNIIIVKDGSGCDDIEKFINENYNFHIPLIFIGYEDNKGPGYARNYGINHSNADLIAIMDSDDESLSNRFSLQIAEFKKRPNLSLCGTFISEIDSDTLEVYAIRKVPINFNEIKKCITYRSPFNNITVMFKRDVYMSIGGYPNKRTSEDYYLWGKFIKNGYDMLNIPISSAHVKFDKSSLSRRVGLALLKDDIDTQRSLLNDQLITKFIYIRNIFIYSIFRLSPKWLLTLLYRIFLRK